MDWLPWVLLPSVGAVIGFATNWLAIRMLFHPREKRFGVQGLLPRRQADLARSIGQVVGEDLLRIEQVLEPLANLDVRPHAQKIIDAVIADKIKSLQAIPVIGSMITPDRLSGIRGAVLDEIDKRRPEIMAGVIGVATEHINVSQMVTDRVEQFDLDQLEAVVHRVAKTEFRAIEMWGALLGLLIGLAQAALLVVMG